MRATVSYIVGCCLLLLLAGCKSGQQLPSLEESYARDSKDPFGTYVLHRQLNAFYSSNSIQYPRRNFEKTWQDIDDSAALYISITRNLFLTQSEISSMLAYVYQGNTLVLASSGLDERLLDTLGCKIQQSYGSNFASMRSTRTQLSDSIYTDTAAFAYFYVPLESHFTRYDTGFSVVISRNRSGVDGLLIFYGKGRFYLHTEPRVFSNYFLSQRNNLAYSANFFSYTPAEPEHVYWDDFYQTRRFPPNERGARSGLGILLQYPAMAWAFWLLLAMVALYILFSGKRRQRIVPPMPENVNTTLAFTETVGRLYLQNKDNRNIADKIITYLLEYIRNQFYLNTGQVNDAFIQTLSRKVHAAPEKVQSLFQLIQQVQQSETIDDRQLLDLNQRVENFYKNKL